MHAGTNILCIDLCRSNMIKHIKCDTPCSEGYEVTNLISTNFVNRCKGFLAERFIKPPINITFDFSSNIHISYIVIHCQVGAQKTMGLELFSETHKTEGQFQSIGSGVLPEDKIGFVFRRHNETATNSSESQYFYKTFRSSRHLVFVDRLKVKIFRTSGSTVPAIGKIEIWGKPCNPQQIISGTTNIPTNKRLSRTTTNNEDVHCHQAIVPELAQQGQPPCRRILKAQHCSYNCLPTNEEKIQIPEDFIDPITCEIMAQPLIMPSGKIIDNSTLESYIKEEEKWGRGANDPFTGVLFTAINKPIVASDLKMRIDMYLSKNSHNIEFFGIPRTVGRSKAGSIGKVCLPSISNLVSDTSTTVPLVVNLSSGNSTVENKDFHKTQPTAKRQKLEIEMCNTRISTDSSDSFKYSTSSRKNLKSISFQEMVDRSLELSLQQTLAQLPKFTTAQVCAGSQQITLECHVCKIRNDLFSIPCKHFVCRNCLICSKTRNMSVCQLCKSQFKACDAVKIHLPS